MSIPVGTAARDKSPCDHRGRGGEAHAECFHRDCLIDMTFADGSYLLKNRQGHVRRVSEDQVVRVL
jgi:hypothetical protein